MIHQIVSILAILTFVSFTFCGLMASKHIDPGKKAEALDNIDKEGASVAESILTQDGLKWAKMRNWSLIVFALVILPYAIIKALLQG